MTWKERLSYLWLRSRRQKLVGQSDTHTHLQRCLSTLQMTAIGLGSTIGVGIYVLLGVAIRDYAGPAVVLSFLLAGLVVLTNAMIYAEFGSYIPHTGASYTYVYCVLGELAAFLTGWMGTLSLWASAATGARAWSGFVDSLFNNAIQTYLDQKVGQLDLGPPFSRSLDWMALTFFLAVTLVVSCNVHCSSIINTVLAVLTTSVLVFVTVAGPIIGDVSRLWDSRQGGFMPHGFSGVVAGASAAFFAFNGYDSICIAAEEAKDPVKSVPRAILSELLIVTLVYCGAAVGTVSLIPYGEIDLRAPIPSAFAYQGVTWAKILVTVGPVIAITNLSILGLYAQSRIAYRMAKDGLFFKRFSYIHPKTKVPLMGVVFFGVIVALISLVFELKDLVRFSVLCMLFQYMVLAPALIAVRAADYQQDSSVQNESPSRSVKENGNSRRSQNNAERSKTFDGLSDRDGRVSQTSPGLHHASDELRDPLAPATYSYVSEGDLGFGANHSDDSADSFLGQDNHQQTDASPLVDLAQEPPTSQNHEEEEEKEISSQEPAHDSQTLNITSKTPSQRGVKPLNLRRERKNMSCFENTRVEFFKWLTNARCLFLLVLLLAALAVQLGLSWRELARLRPLAVFNTTLTVLLVVFLCEVLRKRCGPGRHEGFKVPLVPYLPAVSCFLNMLLLVSAADAVGIAEFSVLIGVGLVVYVIMVLSQWSKRDDVTSLIPSQSEELRNLMSNEGEDADSEGSL